MVEIGYALSSEEHTASALLVNAPAAEEAGFGFAFISDHYHPWSDRQGPSPCVCSVSGVIAATTTRLRLGTRVTFSTRPGRPAIIAKATAPSTCRTPGRFIL